MRKLLLLLIIAIALLVPVVPMRHIYAQANHLATVAAGMSPHSFALLNSDDGGLANYRATNALLFPDGVFAHQTDTILSYAMDAVYDATGDAIWYSGAAHYVSGTNGAPQRTIKYDVASNVWSVVGTSGTYDAMQAQVLTSLTSCGFAGHSVYNAIDTSRRQMYYGRLTDSNECRTRYDLATGMLVSNVQPISAPGGGVGGGEASEDYFPDRDRMVFVAGAGYSEYNPGANSWSTTHYFTLSMDGIGNRGAVAKYSARCKCVMMFGGTADLAVPPVPQHGMWQIDASGTLTRKSNIPASLTIYRQDALAAVDPVTGFLIVISHPLSDPTNIASASTGVIVMWRYDPLTDVWNELDASALNSGGSADTANWWTNFCINGGTRCPAEVVMAPISTYGVIAIMSGVATTGSTSNSAVYLYKAPAMTFAEKCASTGVVGCYDFESLSNLRKFPAVAYPANYGQWVNGDGSVCDLNRPNGQMVAGGYTKARTTGEYNLQALGQPFDDNLHTKRCVYPTINTSTPLDGVGSLQIDIPTYSNSGIGGYFDSPFAGLDQTQVRIGPDNGGSVWIQYRTLSHAYYTSWDQINSPYNLFNNAFGNGLAKNVIWGFAPDTSLDYFGSDVALSGVFGYHSQHGMVFDGYQRDGAGILENFDRGSSPIYLQNASGCQYTGLGPSSYQTQSACILSEDDVNYELTFNMSLPAVASDFSISGTTLTKTGAFADSNYRDRSGCAFMSEPCLSWINTREIYIANDGFYQIASKTNDNSVILAAMPTTQGAGATVFVSGYNNGIFKAWVGKNGVTTQIHDINDVSYAWNYAPAGWGQIRLSPQLTGKDDTVDHPPAYVLYDNLIISKQPIGFLSSTSSTPPPSTTTRGRSALRKR